LKCNEGKKIQYLPNIFPGDLRRPYKPEINEPPKKGNRFPIPLAPPDSGRLFVWIEPIERGGGRMDKQWYEESQVIG
jgi:hypothetical protein